MSSYHPPAGPPTRNGEARHNGHNHGSDGSHSFDSTYEDWAARSRLVVTPIAAPSILGLFGFAGATFMVASNLAGWWGNALLSPVIIAPFAIFFGGLAQLLAAMWSYRARDGVATAMHGTWGAFWLAWGMTALMAANGLLPPNVFTTQAFGFWWIVLAVVTLFGALAALGENIGIFLVLILLAAGSALLAAGLISPASDIVTAGGWVLVASSAAAFYTAGAMMLKSSFKGRVILPVGEWSMRGNLPGHRAVRPISYPMGEPGTKVGQ